MGLTADMIRTFKRIHHDIFLGLLFNSYNTEAIGEFMQQIDDVIKSILHYLQLKKGLDEDEKKQLAQLADDIKKIYVRIEKDKLDEKYHQLLEKIKDDELKMVQEAIDERQVNRVIEDKLGELHDLLEKLIETITDFKYEYANRRRTGGSNLFDAMFKMDAANNLLKEIEMIQDNYKEECRLMGEIEDVEKSIRNGEMSLQQLLDQCGIDPAKEGIDIGSVGQEELKPLLVRIMKLASEIKKRKAEE